MSHCKPTITGNARLRPGPVASRPKPGPNPALPTAAFTLIELLTVITIIGILAAITIPVAGRVRASARTAKCASNWRQTGAALHAYAADHRDTLPITAFNKNSNSFYKQVAYNLAPYMGYDHGWKTNLNTPRINALKDFIQKKMGCSESPKWDFGYNVWMDEKKLDAITTPSRLIYGIDLHDETATSQWLDDTSITQKLKTAAPKPHSGKVNALYVDGHVRTARASQIMLGDIHRAQTGYDGTDDDKPVGDPACDR
ncbi:MAG: prepilin-type N-terminal cleavage/methylation domain-containing protein [Opitutaceae bacterium]|jgi:prepilin-type processing-associated H-X9-DG protein/prepilin-type N-terminal cleavage/methylation domain-containing protein|nr:prepilin-type N-terminal cleavage/methylation domain-containing protein [Opitutaceae bacterium]